ncbi:YcbK family protein [Aureimonas fodinaquatilis]|nr:D-Ala-D-Ala carboxypeptidase family metallohydrolase [Aureimonas fodinaquatilis]
MMLVALSGCMSALDESSAFGFNQSQAAAEAKDAGEAADTATVATAGAEQNSAENLLAAAATKPETATAEAKPVEVSAAEPAAPAAPAAETPAKPQVLAAYSSTPAPARRAESSLYATLFERAEREQPAAEPLAEPVSHRVVVTQTNGAGKPSVNEALPGVDPSSLFQIGRRASVDSEDLMDDIGGSYQIASLGGMARLAPNGLMVQRDDVNTSCFGTDLVRLLRQIEGRFGKQVVITSGYRSPSHNRRVRGAKASMHMACKAADLHVPGVSGQEVARFVRALPGRGGVGTYCHTAAIHVDVGRQRDWNWPCRRRG